MFTDSELEMEIDGWALVGPGRLWGCGHLVGF